MSMMPSECQCACHIAGTMSMAHIVPCCGWDDENDVDFYGVPWGKPSAPSRIEMLEGVLRYIRTQTEYAGRRGSKTRLEAFDRIAEIVDKVEL